MKIFSKNDHPNHPTQWGSQADHGFYNSAMSRGNSDTTLKTKS